MSQIYENKEKNDTIFVVIVTKNSKCNTLLILNY